MDKDLFGNIVKQQEDNSNYITCIKCDIEQPVEQFSVMQSGEIKRTCKSCKNGHKSIVKKLRRENADIALGYKNPKWLAPTIFESYLRSESEKMSFNKGAEIRKYLFLKMKNLIPNNHNLKIFLRINNIK